MNENKSCKDYTSAAFDWWRTAVEMLQLQATLTYKHLSNYWLCHDTLSAVAEHRIIHVAMRLDEMFVVCTQNKSTCTRLKCQLMAQNKQLCLTFVTICCPSQEINWLWLTDFSRQMFEFQWPNSHKNNHRQLLWFVFCDVSILNAT